MPDKDQARALVLLARALEFLNTAKAAEPGREQLAAEIDRFLNHNRPAAPRRGHAFVWSDALGRSICIDCGSLDDTEQGCVP
jgi:hypothetical protein